MISAEQFAEWKEHPVTKEIFAEIKGCRDCLKNQLANGDSLGASADETHGLTNRVVGQITGLEQLLNISYAKEEIGSDGSENGY